MRGIRPYDQSLALKTIARGSAPAFHLAVMDKAIREYLISQRESHFSEMAVYTQAWANGFVRNTEAFVTAIHETGDSPTDLATLAGLPPAGMEFIEFARRGTSSTNREATPGKLAALLSSRTESVLEIEILRDMLDVVDEMTAYRTLMAVGRDPLQVMLEGFNADYEGDQTHLFVHLAYRRMTGADISVAEVIRLTALGLIDPVTLERAAADAWPDEYAHAFDAER